jgi:hypothetical protein
MRTRTLIVGLVLLLISAFLAVNWAVFAASAKVSFVFTSVEVPVGMVMLGIFTLIALTADSADRHNTCATELTNVNCFSGQFEFTGTSALQHVEQTCGAMAPTNTHL